MALTGDAEGGESKHPAEEPEHDAREDDGADVAGRRLSFANNHLQVPFMHDHVNTSFTR